MMKLKGNTRIITIGGILIAMEIILTRFIQIPLPYFEFSKDRISLGFLPVAIGGMLFGPVGGGVIAALADIVRAVLLPQGGAINPLFTLTACLRGVIYGFFFRKSIKPYSVISSSAIICIFINITLNSLFTFLCYGGTFWARVISKAPIAGANLIIQCILLSVLLPPLKKEVDRYV